MKLYIKKAGNGIEFFTKPPRRRREQRSDGKMHTILHMPEGADHTLYADQGTGLFSKLSFYVKKDDVFYEVDGTIKEVKRIKTMKSHKVVTA